MRYHFGVTAEALFSKTHRIAKVLVCSGESAHKKRPPAGSLLFMFARHVFQLEGASPLSNLMEVKD
jgi:hypothetical protein